VNIIGLGEGGCRIADTFAQYPEYSIYKIDHGETGLNCYDFPPCRNPEEYEAVELPQIETFLEKIEGDSIFVVVGGGQISCASLRIMEGLQKNNLSVLYVRPDISLLNREDQMLDKITFNVLQQYARSGVFETLYLASNPIIDGIIGGAPIIGYYDKLNEQLVSVFHMIQVFSHSSPVIGKLDNPKVTHRIVSIGMLDMVRNTENMFFYLDDIRERCYIYCINEEKLKSDDTLMRKITSQVRGKSTDEIRTSYAVYPTDYSYDLCYVIDRTPHIQGKEKK
jgi:hypothetical protein